VPARSELRVGTATEVQDAVSRSHLPDGRVVGWYGERGVVIDAEVLTWPLPARLAARFGAEHFWARWTAAECAAKLHSIPMHLWIREHGLTSPGVEVERIEVADLVVSLGRLTRGGRA